MNKAAQKFAQVTALNGVRICHRSIGETSKPAVLMEYDGGHNLGNDDTVRGLIEAAIVEHIALQN